MLIRARCCLTISCALGARVSPQANHAGTATGGIYESMLMDVPPAPEYLRLGMDYGGMIEVLELIGITYQWAGKVKSATATGSSEMPHPDNLEHRTPGDDWVTYSRPDSMQWATDEYGPFVSAESVEGSDGRYGDDPLQISVFASASRVPCPTCW